MFLKKDTGRTILIGPFIDDTDGKTAETGLASSPGSIDIDLYKGAATSVTTSITATTSGGSNDIAHVANGYYSLELTAANVDTCGELKITANIAGSLPVWHNFQIVEETVYDALFGDVSGAGLQVNVTQIEGSDATDQINAACDASIVTYNLDHLMAAAVASNADMTAEVVDGSVLSNILTKTGDTSDYAYATDSLEALGENAAAILTDTAEIGSAGAGLTAVPWNAAWDAEVQSECTDALNAYDPPTKAEMDAMWTTGLTESYAANGAEPTPAQFLFMIWSCMSDFGISSTTITSKKLDDSTAMIWTIDSATDPTARNRTS